jgi:hypothetical protein
MQDLTIHPGDLVILSQAYERYAYERHPSLKVSLVNRLAKVEDVIDWDSDRGKKIEEARIKSGRWKDYSAEAMADNRYILSIYYPEMKGATGKPVVETAPMFSKDPKTGASFFSKVPDWLYKAIMAKCQTFIVIKEGDA